MPEKHLSSAVKLSVAVITYNQEQTIAQTLDSILQQMHDYIYEIVIGEDCSTDRTREILQEYQSRYPNVIRLLLNETNLGLVKNYFNVIEHCRGEYVMQCAGDDWWLPGKIALQIPYMDKHPECGMCYTKAAEFIQEQERQKGCWGGKYTEFDDLIRANTVPALTVVMRKVLLRRYIDEICPLSQEWRMEDYPIWLWFAYNSQIDFLDDVSAVYRVLQSSASHYENVEKAIEFSSSVIDIQTFFYKRYTPISYDPALQKWQMALHKYAIYNKWKQFICLWWSKVKTSSKAVFCFKPYVDLIFFLLPFLRSRYRS